MKTKYIIILCAFAVMGLIHPVSAQELRITAFGQEGLTMGGMTKKAMNDNAAGYVETSSTAGLEFNYYLDNNLGFGLRGVVNYYTRDIDSYESDLVSMLGISGRTYDLTQTYAFWSAGSDLGISYLLDLSARFQLEPYIYGGLQLLQSPVSSMIYLQDNTTYQYRSKSQYYLGVKYAPGVKAHLNVHKLVGFYFSLEYAGNYFFGADERSMISSYNTLEITDTEKNYRIGSFSLGIGLALKFGKGIQDPQL